MRILSYALRYRLTFSSSSCCVTTMISSIMAHLSNTSTVQQMTGRFSSTVRILFVPPMREDVPAATITAAQ